MATTTNVSNLKINVLTKEQYDAATKDENQLYLITNNILGEYLELTGGTLTGQLILAADPTENLGAATKQYVDAQTSNSITTALNRTTAVNTADTNYAILMARGTSLNSTETTPNVNGAMAWTYE